MQLTQTGSGTGLGIKSEPKISETVLSFFSSVPLWEMLNITKLPSHSEQKFSSLVLIHSSRAFFVLWVELSPHLPKFTC